MLIQNKSCHADSPPDDVEDLFDDLDAGNDYHEVTSHLTIKQAGWLAVYIRDRSLKERETIGEEIERDLKVSGSMSTLSCFLPLMG